MKQAFNHVARVNMTLRSARAIAEPRCLTVRAHRKLLLLQDLDQNRQVLESLVHQMH